MNFLNLISSETCKRKNNKFVQLLSSIWQNSNSSRHELANELNISRVAVTKNIEQLINWNMLDEAPGLVSNSRGRRSIPLVLNESLFYSIGISLHDHKQANIVFVNARDKILEEVVLKNVPNIWQEKCDFLIDHIKILIKKHDIPANKILGIGIVLTGIMNPATGIVKYSSQFSEDINFNLIEYFKTNLDLNCFLINVSHLKAYIEHKWGLAKNMSSFLCLHTEFGLGIFLNGALYYGHQCQSGLLGLMQIASNGPQCRDGRIGTLDTLAPLYKITDKLDDIIESGGKTKVRNYLLKGESKVTLPMVISAIEDGDQLCAEMMSNAFSIMGQAVVNLAYLFNPETIFLPKWTSRCPEVTLAVVKRIMGHYGVSNWDLKCDIQSAACGNEEIASGAAMLPIENILGNKL